MERWSEGLHEVYSIIDPALVLGGGGRGGRVASGGDGGGCLLKTLDLVRKSDS